MSLQEIKTEHSTNYGISWQYEEFNSQNENISLHFYVAQFSNHPRIGSTVNLGIYYQVF